MHQNIRNLTAQSLSIIYIALILISVLPASAEESVRPGINTYYQNPDFKTWQRRFESPGREVYDMADEIVDALNVKPGMHIADIGAGTGLFTRRFASKLNNTGQVYAVDISKVFINNILQQVKQAGLKNVKGIVNTDKSILLESNSIDLAFVCDTYHHFEYPSAMLKSISKSLRKNGLLVIIDFRKVHGTSSQWVMGHVRANRNTVKAEIQQAGFRFLREEDMLQENYIMVFQKQGKG
ncbi:MAG: methyltransferase domain-containing protein [Gammaproteobacteria bacterium]|nr:methyltransferase domain-containing protein [Gammaproteobacteria bacterium]